MQFVGDSSEGAKGRRARGFSLAEVAMAVAVAGVAVVSVVGLVPGLLDSEQGSSANTAVTAMATQAVCYVKSQPYYKDATAKTTPDDYTLYFGNDGNLLMDSSQAAISNANDPRAIYACHVTQGTITPDTTPTPAPSTATGTTSTSSTNNNNNPNPGPHCRRVILDFAWPAAVASTTRNHKTLYATVPEN